MTIVSIDITLNHPTNPAFNQNISVKLDIPNAIPQSIIPEYLLGALTKYFQVTQTIFTVGELKY